MEYILVGKIINTFGIKGELKVESHSDFIDERFKYNSVLYIGEEHIQYKAKSYRFHNGFVLLTLIDNEDINLISKLKNQNIYIKESELKPLDSGYYFKDLLGLDVFMNENKVGQIVDVEDGSSSKYIRVLKGDGKTSLIPFVKAFINKVDLQSKKIQINDIKGLL